MLNLDQLRPLFPLGILTMHAITDTTLAANVKRVAAGMGIEIRPDLEPERNLNQRTDHFPFLKMGVPATSFVFGFDAGTESERRYREWYQVRYHRPQDDMSQPLDWGAARDMNTFLSVDGRCGRRFGAAGLRYILRFVKRIFGIKEKPTAAEEEITPYVDLMKMMGLVNSVQVP